MSYWEEVSGTIHFKKNVPPGIIDLFCEDLHEYISFDDMTRGVDKKHDLKYVDFSAYESHASEVSNVLENTDYLKYIYVGFMYVNGEEHGDCWRMRKLAYEDEWRYEYSTIVYDGDDIPLWGNADKVQVDANALNNML